ncbi:hypothetical protein R6Q59_020989 [Mikania micrantha]|uniref:SKP1 component dimerisation domain-containing protein n=1 Tax=Mikania micrantha TaxID=192012 RepID=A0A5N6PPM8_9ASTR|nr:hypothetical protein E3N88_44244 [Mikania micrantha]KAD6795107.1 hypothetical protein E3N88_06003 [Mikania micrantha]
MSQTVVLEQNVATQSITLKFNASSSNANPTPTVDPITQNPVNETDPITDQENQSISIKNEDHGSNHAIQIPNVDSQTQAAVNEFIQNHRSPDEEVRTGAMNDLRSFVERLEIGALMVLLKFASDANNSELLDVLCERMANVIKDKTVEEVREIFNITNDFTPEEEQAIRDEHAWAFED